MQALRNKYLRDKYQRKRQLVLSVILTLEETSVVCEVSGGRIVVGGMKTVCGISKTLG